MNNNSFKQIVDRLAAEKAQKRQSKSNRTLSLEDRSFKDFQEFCKAQGLSASEVIDQLIVQFLDEVHPDREKEAG